MKKIYTKLTKNTKIKKKNGKILPQLSQSKWWNIIHSGHASIYKVTRTFTT